MSIPERESHNRAVGREAVSRVASALGAKIEVAEGAWQPCGNLSLYRYDAGAVVRLPGGRTPGAQRTAIREALNAIGFSEVAKHEPPESNDYSLSLSRNDDRLFIRRIGQGAQLGQWGLGVKSGGCQRYPKDALPPVNQKARPLFD